jgi:oligopeptide/dipeptide ABC transporter ATP-binding protein
VRDVSFDLTAGETLGLTGETGCGKSTLALAVLGLLGKAGRLLSGEIRFEGESLTGLSDSECRRHRGARIGFVFQDARGALNPVMTIGQHLTEAIRAHRRVSAAEARERGRELLAEAGVPEPKFVMDRHASELSGGMCQRIGIALAICHRPRLLIADEPTSALDPTVQRQILDLIHDLKERHGLALLLISHDIALLSELADRLAVMYHGRLVEQGPPKQVLENPGHPYTRALARCAAVLNGGRKGESLANIPGSPPRAGEEFTGCAFASRCESVGPECTGSAPPLRPVAEAHYVACVARESASARP